MSEIDNIVKQLVDETEIRRVVDGIDLATDAKAWELCRSYFTDEILADFTLLAGRRTGLDARRRPRKRVENEPLSREAQPPHAYEPQDLARRRPGQVFSKGYALNILERDTGSDLWEVWGEYTHTLERTADGWKCSGITFLVTHARGNEMARQFVPDSGSALQQFSLSACCSLGTDTRSG